MGEVISIAYYVNSVKIEQKVEDGFVNATAMCVAHGKEIKFWLQNKETFELFEALSNEININRGDSNVSCNSRLSATKYQKIFPELIVVKQGSPEFGGGVWIHPDLAIQLAQWCNKRFAIQVSRWVRKWLVKGFQDQSKTVSQLEKEYELYCQKLDLRVTLKDSLRPELMEVVKKYAKRNDLHAHKLCYETHDAMNLCIQGHRSKDLKAMGSLPIGELIRDHFDTNSLYTYLSINRLAINSIVDRGVHPIDAVKEACRSYLGITYDAKPHKLTGDIYQEGKKIRKKINNIKQHQYNLFGGYDVI